MRSGNQEKSIFRKLTSAVSSRFSQADLFYNNYINKSTQPQSIAFSTKFPGTIRAILIPPNSSYYLYRDCLLCLSDTIQVSAEYKIDITSKKYLTIRYSTREKPGMIWIYSHGNIIDLPMKANSSFRVNDDLLLSISDAVSIRRIPKVELFTGEGKLTVISAKKDTTIYLQSHPETLEDVLNDENDIKDKK